MGDGGSGSYTLTCMQTTTHNNPGFRYFTIFVVESPCNAKVDGLSHTGYPGDSMRKSINRYETVPLFLDADCEMYRLVNCPNWVSFDKDNLEILVDIPNTVQAVGEHTCSIMPGNAEVNINVKKPCTSQYMSGLDDEGILTLRLDEERTLELKLKNDDNGISWSEVCGDIDWT